MYLGNPSTLNRTVPKPISQPTRKCHRHDNVTVSRKTALGKTRGTTSFIWNTRQNFRNFFYILLTVHLVTILVNKQLDALSLMHLFITPLYMFRTAQCSSSGDRIVLIHHLLCISLCRWLSGMPARTGIPDSHLHRVIFTRRRVNTIDLLMMNTVLFETCR